MFEFEGDWFNAGMISAVLCVGNELHICVSGDSEPTALYEYDNEDLLYKGRDKFIAAWQAACVQAAQAAVFKS